MKSFYIKINSLIQARATASALASLGLKFGLTYNKNLETYLNYYPAYTYLGYHECYDGLDWWNKELSDIKLLTLDEAIKYVETELEVRPISVELNSKYTAEVSRDSITVGCQTFTFAKFDELSRAVQAIRAQLEINKKK